MSASGSDWDDEKPRVLAIDPGKKRIGLAISDPTGHFAVGLDTLSLSDKTDAVSALCEIARQYAACRIVIGLPVHMNGQEGSGALDARALGEALATALDVPVSYLDERLTSVLAQQTLRAGGIKPSRHKAMIDRASAVRILQDYLDRNRA